jgi:hypothetical protein
MGQSGAFNVECSSRRNGSAYANYRNSSPKPRNPEFLPEPRNKKEIVY